MRTRQFFIAPPPAGLGGYSFEADADGFEPGMLNIAQRMRPAGADSLLATFAEGGDDIATYDSIAAIQAAITAGHLTNGEEVRVTWTGDTYHGSGDRLIRVVQGCPSWQGVIPWSKIATATSVIASSGSPVNTTDVDGRPLLQVPAVDGTFLELLLGFSAAPAKRFHLHGQFQYGTATNNGGGVASASIRRVGDATKYIQVFNQYIGGQWVGGWYYQSNGTFGTDALDVDFNNANKYNVTKAVEFIMAFATTGAQPLTNYTYRSTGDGSATPTAVNTAAGEGDFTIATQLWEPFARLRSTGAAGEFLITGVEYNTRT
jgi:hypothetical protein